MDPFAIRNCESFFHTYAKSITADGNIRVVDIRSSNDGNLRSACPAGFEYVGIDIASNDPYSLPFDDKSINVVLSNSCFEHVEMFWLTFLEVLRILKPNGIFYLNVPSTGDFYQSPVDCWRFYPDSGRALVNWARKNGLDTTMLESYTQKGGKWQSCVSVFLKSESLVGEFPNRILDSKTDFENGWLFQESEIRNCSVNTQDDKKIQAIVGIINESITVV